MKDEVHVKDLRDRTKVFAVRVIRMTDALPQRRSADVIGRQVLRSGMSVGAQYREACRSRSNAELISKLESTLQELDETGYWFELLVEAKLVPDRRLESLRQECDELTRIFVAGVKKLKTRKRR
jgi:four helix bundle protein